MRVRLAVLSLGVLASFGHAADWTQFRGPRGDNVAESRHPFAWGEGTNLAWKVDLPGDGWSSPIVVDGRVLLTTAVPTPDDAYRFELHAFDAATGGPLWRRTAIEGPPRVPIHRDNSYATETAAAEGGRVIAYFGMRGCFCYDLEGNKLWEKDLGAYEMANGWGASSSPVVFDGLVFLQIDNEEASQLVALDAATGDLRWRVERPDEVSNWSTPVVWRNSARNEIVAGGKTVRSYDAATGRELWSMPIGGRSAATASAVGDTLIIGSENRVRRGGTPGGLFAVAAGAQGELNVFDPPEESGAREQGLRWANLRGAIGISSPLVHGGLVYAPARAAGVVAVHDALTGELLEKGRIRGAARFWASPWSAGGRVFLLDEDGETFVLKPGADLEVERTNRLPGRFWSSVAVADDTLIVRSQDRLFAIR